MSNLDILFMKLDTQSVFILFFEQKKNSTASHSLLSDSEILILVFPFRGVGSCC